MIPKNELIRIVKLADGTVEVDRTGKKSGRGTYVCQNPECRDNALKVEHLAKALNTNISQDMILHIKEELENL